VAVSLARAFPKLGIDGGPLKPELLIGKFGVMTIFFLSGLSLELSELKDAVRNHRLNLSIQIASFGAWPLLVGIPLTTTIKKFFPNLLPPPLVDGILVLTTLPTTVNMCVFLTSAAGGNVASALCNAVLGNLFGVFITPAWLFLFFGKSIEVPFLAMLAKICSKVLVPVTVGQMVRGTNLKSVYEGNKKGFKRLQEIVLLGIVWNAFSNTFFNGIGLSSRNVITMLILVPSLHIFSVLVLFSLFRAFFSPDQTIAAVFCASHKTLAFGLPLIKTIFEGNENLAAYCAPIMFAHPVQLFLGTLISSRLKTYAKEGKAE